MKVNYIKLKEITTKIGSGATPRGGGENYKSEGITLIRSLNVYDNNFKMANLAFIDEQQAYKLRNVIVKKNDVLINITGASVCRCTIVPEEVLPARVNQHVSIVRANEESLNPHFLVNVINSKSYKDGLLNLAFTGATREALTKSDIENFKVPVPSLPIQRKIAAILSAYDELIENNNRRIGILEKMAEEIYREWFVRLRFPGHENVKVVKGIPEGWEVKGMTQLKKINFVTDRLQPFDGLKNYYATADIDGINIGNPTELIQYVNKPSRAQYIPYLYSVWFARMKNTFKVLGISDSNAFLSKKIIISSGFAGFQTEKHYFPYLFCLIKSDSFHFLKDLYTTGATQESLTNEGLSKMKIIFPDGDLLRLFGEKTFDLIDQIFMLQIINKNLKTSRDLLLPRLISGKLDVENLDIIFPPGMEEKQEKTHA